MKETLKEDQPFILSRGNGVGSGKYVAHWTGDNGAEFIWLFLSLPTTMLSNMFGIPMVGADVCGFKLNTTEDLCSRWSQVGVLYPFARNHNDNTSTDQEPWALGPTVLNTVSQAIHFRYSIVKHYYSEFMEKNGTGVIFKPVFFEYPSDMKLYDYEVVNTQFMIGDDLFVSPVISSEQESRYVYFPDELYYDYFKGDIVYDKNFDS